MRQRQRRLPTASHTNRNETIWDFWVATPCQVTSLDHASFGCRARDRTRDLTARYSVIERTLYPLGYFGPKSFVVLPILYFVTTEKELDMKDIKLWRQYHHCFGVVLMQLFKFIIECISTLLLTRYSYMKTINILFTFIKNAQFLQSEFNCNEKY